MVAITDRDIIQGIKLAIKRERQAQALYILLTKKAQDTNAAQLFERLFAEEVKHEQALRAYLDTGSFTTAYNATKYKVYGNDNVTALDIVGILKHSFSSDISGLQEGMKLAMREERKAADLYMKLYQQTIEKNKPAELQQLFMQFAKEEERHEEKIRDEYIELFRNE